MAALNLLPTRFFWFQVPCADSVGHAKLIWLHRDDTKNHQNSKQTNQTRNTTAARQEYPSQMPSCPATTSVMRSNQARRNITKNMHVNATACTIGDRDCLWSSAILSAALDFNPSSKILHRSERLPIFVDRYCNNRKPPNGILGKLLSATKRHTNVNFNTRWHLRKVSKQWAATVFSNLTRDGISGNFGREARRVGNQSQRATWFSRRAYSQ